MVGSRDSQGGPRRSEIGEITVAENRFFALPVDLLVMNVLRRGLLVGGLAVLIGLAAKMLGKSDFPKTADGWRQLEGPDFR